MTCTPPTLLISREKCYRCHSLAFIFRLAEGTRHHEDFYTTVMAITRKLTVISSQWGKLFFMHLARGKNKSRENLFSCAWNYLQNKTAQGSELPFLRTYLFPVLAELNFYQATLFTILLKEKTFSTPVFVFLEQDSNQQPGGGGGLSLEEEKAPDTP